MEQKKGYHENNFYNLSKNYHRLYFHLCQGKTVVGFVNYQFRGMEGKHPPSRDTCKIVRRNPYDISFGARGIEYGSISDYFADKETEYNLFLSECERMNVEWIVP